MKTLLKIDLNKELDALVKQRQGESDFFVKEVKMLMEANAAEEIAILKESGLGKNIMKAERQTAQAIREKKISEEYNGGIYSESQIKDIAIKYNLRFLSTQQFSGNVAPEVGSVLLRFKNKHLLTDDDIQSRLYILAPAKMFTLQEKPVDPLLFYKIKDRHSDEYSYKLIHKWGEDFTISRRISGIIHKSPFTLFMTEFLPMLLILFVFNKFMFTFFTAFQEKNVLTFMEFAPLLLIIIVNIIGVVVTINNLLKISDYRNETSEFNWNNEYKF